MLPIVKSKVFDRSKNNVAVFLTEKARELPEYPAVLAPLGRKQDGSIHYARRTFDELEQDASATAFYFKSCGIARGTRVLLMVKPGLDLIRIVFALFKMGAVPVVIDPGMGLSSFLRCVKHSKPTAVVGIPTATIVSRLFRGSFRSVSAKISVGRAFEDRIASFRSSGEFQVVNSASDELAAVLFTSGSTGPAKGVCYAHGMFAAQVEAIRGEYGIEPGEIDLPMLPVFALFNPALGMTTIVPEMNPSRPATVDPQKIVQSILQNQVTNSFGSPALWTKIGRYCRDNAITLPSVRRILMAGAPVASSLMELMKTIIPNGEIFTPYGATEALPVSSIIASEVLAETAADTQKGLGTCVGRPLGIVEAKVIKACDEAIESIANVEFLGERAIGEIIVKGASVTRRYDDRPEADALSKIPDADDFWHRMGDLGYFDSKGRLWFCGRKVERVETEKEVLYTDCCEAIFNQHEAVFRSALIDLGNGLSGIVIEPEEGKFPRNDSARQEWIQSLKLLGEKNSMTRGIQNFFFEKKFPVDVRHNAKIHRLSLAKKYRLK